MDRLTTTTFFMQAKQDAEHSAQSLKSEYCRFAKELYALCQELLDPVQRFFILTYTLIEFKAVDHRSSYLDRAIELLEAALKWQRQYAQPHRLAPSITPTSQFAWTGKIVELVELIYALDSRKCINNGDVKIEELVGYIGTVFGVEIKNCFNTYVDMKKRKSDSRTCFLDDMGRRLNDRMNGDDEKTRR